MPPQLRPRKPVSYKEDKREDKREEGYDSDKEKIASRTDNGEEFFLRPLSFTSTTREQWPEPNRSNWVNACCICSHWKIRPCLRLEDFPPLPAAIKKLIAGYCCWNYIDQGDQVVTVLSFDKDLRTALESLEQGQIIWFGQQDQPWQILNVMCEDAHQLPQLAVTRPSPDEDDDVIIVSSPLSKRRRK